MRRGSRSTRRMLTTAVVIGFTLIPLQATADRVFEFATPIFGLAATGGSLLVADAGAGIVEVRGDELTLLAELPGLSDVDPAGNGNIWAVGGAGNWGVYQVNRNHTRQIADLLEFETAVNPHPEAIDSNPFDIEAGRHGGAIVADAGGNSLLSVDNSGNVDWIATLPDELVSTANIKGLAGCPNPAEGFEFACELPDMMPAQGVATSVAIGPDGAYYVGELKGFPAPTNESRIWRIDPSARHAECGISPLCTVVVDGGFTSIVDLVLGPQGLYVTEIDEASWAAVEFGLGAVGGTVNVCNITTWACSVVATGLDIPIATAVTPRGDVFTALSGLISGVGEIVELP
jgi:hypothetical protein